MPQVLIGCSQQAIISPDGHAVLAPEDAQGPARQGLTRIPLALGGVDQGPRGEPVPQAAGEHLGPLPLVLTQGRRGPLGGIHVVNGHEGGLSPLGKAHVHGLELGIHLSAQGLDVDPLRVGIGLCDPGVLAEADDLVLVSEGHLAWVGEAIDGCGTAGLGGAGQGDVSLTGEQAGRGIQADPARTGHIHLGPGMQVSEVVVRTRRAIQGFLVRRQLHQIAGHEAGRQTKMAQNLHQQPPCITAGAQCLGQGVLTGLHPGFQPNRVPNGLLQGLVQSHQKIHRTLGATVDARQPGIQQRAILGCLKIGRQFLFQRVRIFKRPLVSVFLDEEIEGVDDRHVGHHLHVHFQFPGLFRKHQSGQPVAVGVLLPIDEVIRRQDLQAVGLDGRAAMYRRQQPDDVGAEGNRAIEPIVGTVV